MGWRPEAKRLLLLMTDQPSHLALDSRLAGIVVPHDGLCHLEKNVYTGSTRMVRSRARTNNNNIKESNNGFIGNNTGNNINVSSCFTKIKNRDQAERKILLVSQHTCPNLPQCLFSNEYVTKTSVKIQEKDP